MKHLQAVSSSFYGPGAPNDTKVKNRTRLLQCVQCVKDRLAMLVIEPVSLLQTRADAVETIPCRCSISTTSVHNVFLMFASHTLDNRLEP